MKGFAIAIILAAMAISLISSIILTPRGGETGAGIYYTNNNLDEAAKAPLVDVKGN